VEHELTVFKVVRSSEGSLSHSWFYYWRKVF